MLSRLTFPLEDESFVTQFKRSAADFTRSRILTFRTVAVLLMAKGSKSLQLSLNELVPKFGHDQSTVSKVAYSKARKKLKHTAFIELNSKAVVATMYEDGTYKTYKGLRVLGIDGSKVQLPTNPETIKEFGSFAYKSQEPNVAGEHSYAIASVLYDVLNRVAIDAKLAPAHAYEVDLAAKHLEHTQAGDLIIYDRGYCSFRMLSLASQAPSEFLIRAHANSFKLANEMLAGKGPDDVIAEIEAPKKFLANPKNKGLPQKLTVRFVRVTLNTGEYEVVGSSLLDQHQYPPEDFKQLYSLRWGIETFYGILKTRLNLENFSGYSVEAIQQDFHVAVLLTGIETILTEDAEEKFTKQMSGHPKKVNRAVSFNAIKYRAFELFYSKEPDEQRLQELTDLFLASPTLIRKDRKPARKQSSSHRLLGWWKRQRKVVF